MQVGRIRQWVLDGYQCSQYLSCPGFLKPDKPRIWT